MHYWPETLGIRHDPNDKSQKLTYDEFCVAFDGTTLLGNELDLSSWQPPVAEDDFSLPDDYTPDSSTSPPSDVSLNIAREDMTQFYEEQLKYWFLWANTEGPCTTYGTKTDVPIVGVW